MAHIRNIKLGEEPSFYINHVCVEGTSSGLFRASGAYNRSGKLEYLSTPRTRDLSKIVEKAGLWADERKIHFIDLLLDPKMFPSDASPLIPEKCSDGLLRV